MKLDIEELARSIVAGDRLALARGLRLVDDRPKIASKLIHYLYPHLGKAHVIGITGNPGAGKSSLTDELIRVLRKKDKRVAILAVDPTSPFTGGAILGDRIRMNQHSGDKNVFIRSLATRGTLGGVSASTYNSVMVMDAAGFDYVVVETVGVGQDEVEIAKTAHTTMVVLVPGLGDDIQSIKAGILEVADLFVINKADRPGVEQAEHDLHIMLSMLPENKTINWNTPILKTVATYGEGVFEVAEYIEKHNQFLRSTQGGRNKLEDQRQRIFEMILNSSLVEHCHTILGEDKINQAKEKAAIQEQDPYELVNLLLETIITTEKSQAEM